MKYDETEISKAFILVEIIEYEPNSLVKKTIINKTNGFVSVMAFDKGEALVEKMSPYDSFTHIIEGNATIVTDNNSIKLKTGDSIIIPAFTTNIVNAEENFTMVQTVLKKFD